MLQLLGAGGSAGGDEDERTGAGVVCGGRQEDRYKKRVLRWMSSVDITAVCGGGCLAGNSHR